jgi:hypothetical protein
VVLKAFAGICRRDDALSKRTRLYITGEFCADVVLCGDCWHSSRLHTVGWRTCLPVTVGQHDEALKGSSMQSGHLGCFLQRARVAAPAMFPLCLDEASSTPYHIGDDSTMMHDCAVPAVELRAIIVHILCSFAVVVSYFMSLCTAPYVIDVHSRCLDKPSVTLPGHIGLGQIGPGRDPETWAGCDAFTRGGPARLDAKLWLFSCTVVCPVAPLAHPKVFIAKGPSVTA